MVERKILVLAIAFVLVTQILVSSELNSAYAFYPPEPIDVNFHWDHDTTNGFEKVVPDPTPEFFLRRGTTGTINITISSTDNVIIPVTLLYGGEARNNYNGSWGNPKNFPDGITYSIEPSNNITLTPNSTVTKTLRISAEPDTEIRSYKLSLYKIVTKGNRTVGIGGSTILTIIEGTSSSLTNTSSITRITAQYVTHTTTLTTTTTETTIIEGFAEISVYAWAIGATSITSILAVVLLRRRGQTS